MINIKKMLFPALLVLILFLGACGDGNTNAEEVDLNGYPESVEIGDISVEYYTELGNFIQGYLSYFEVINDLNSLKEENPGATTDKQFVDTYREAIGKFDEHLNQFYNEASPLTKIDKEIQIKAGNVASAHVVHNQMLLEEINDINIYSDGQKRASLEFIDSLWKDLLEILNQYEITTEH